MQKILSGSLQSLLALREPELLMKAKSEVSLSCTSQSLSLGLNNGRSPRPSVTSGDHSAIIDEEDNGQAASRNGRVSACELSAAFRKPRRARSLEMVNCGAMWSSFVEEIVLKKGERGLGFSILDYQVRRFPKFDLAQQ